MKTLTAGRLLYIVPIALLCAGLVPLHGIFSREREEALRALDDRDRAVVRAAQQTLRMRLSERLDAARGELDRAVADPLADDSQLLLFRGGRQVLPRTAHGRARVEANGNSASAKRLWEVLERDGPRGAEGLGLGPAMADRLRMTGELVRAIDGGNAEAITRGVRSLLEHRVHERVPLSHDAVLTLWTLERLERGARPDGDLMRRLLRDGLEGARGAYLPGLQRAVLSQRDAFTDEDMQFLAPKLVALSDRAGVESRDFAERAGLTGSGGRRATIVPLGEGGALLSLRERPVIAYGYYVEGGDAVGEARGVRVDLAAEVEGVRDELRMIGLLSPDDELSVPVPEGTVFADALPLQRLAPDGEAARTRVRARHAMKSGLLLGSALFGAGFVVFAGLAGSRKRRLVALRGELLATVSHELRTPLSAIRVMAETLQRRAEGAPNVGDYPARIVNETDALSRLVENILAFNRLEKGKLRLRKESVPLRELLEGLAEEVNASAPARLRLDASAVGDARVEADGELLRILLSNLLHNACRHGGRDPVTVKAWAGLEGEWMTVRLADDGRGIPRESWERVFEEYERLPGGSQKAKAQAKAEARASGGNGLGLAICRRIMRLHGGEIRLVTPRERDEKGEPLGATFELGFKP